MTLTPSGVLDGIDLIDGDTYVQGPPHDQWRRLRQEATLYRHPGREVEVGAEHHRFRFKPFWAITKYEDVLRVSRDPQRFISGKGIHMALDPDMEPNAAFGGGTMMITTDPPRHVRLRRLVNKGFTPRMIGTLEPHIRTIVTEIIDGLGGRTSCDFVTDIAALLPLAVICDMMGVPQKDWGHMFDLSNRALGGDDPEYQQTASETGPMELFQYFSQLVLSRMQSPPKNDLLGVILQGDIDGEKLSQMEILFFCFLLIVAGNETTRNATSGGMLALMQHPQQRLALLDDPTLLPSAVEEILRFTSPVIHMARVCTEDTQLRGQLIRAGEKVVMFYPSANRDEDIFPDADAFDVRRTPNDHLAFGIGEHFCLGAGLARLELRVMFEELLRRLPQIELDGPVERLRSSLVAGIKHMPVRLPAIAPA